MSLTETGMTLKSQIHRRPDAGRAKKSKIATPASQPKPSKKRKPYFYNPADRD